MARYKNRKCMIYIYDIDFKLWKLVSNFLSALEQFERNRFRYFETTYSDIYNYFL